MAEKEYIERGAVLRSFAELMQLPFTDWDDAWEVVQKTPTADVAEVRHGAWLNMRKEDCCDGEEPFIVGMVNGCPYASCFCSECGEWLVASDEYQVKGNYCPNCGAKMDGERKEQE